MKTSSNAKMASLNLSLRLLIYPLLSHEIVREFNVERLDAMANPDVFLFLGGWRPWIIQIWIPGEWAVLLYAFGSFLEYEAWLVSVEYANEKEEWLSGFPKDALIPALQTWIKTENLFVYCDTKCCLDKLQLHNRPHMPSKGNNRMFWYLKLFMLLQYFS